MNDEVLEELKNIRRELVTLRQLTSSAIAALRDAEAEVPERIRRFANYMHDCHHIIWTYEERGHQAPKHVKDEMERCDDRFRQLLKELHSEGGTFAKVRANMANDPENRWDHTRLLAKPTEETST